MKYYVKVTTPIHDFYIVEAEDKIVSVSFDNEGIENYLENETPLLRNAKSQLIEYCKGKRQVFDLPLCQEGTEFMTKVWDYMSTIPYGEVVSYKDIAISINHPKAYRAVGMACNRNNIPIFIPCHRVIGSNRKLVGFAGGLDLKESLLKHEINNK
jgi:methylated-DNA-[protein]-cysteine S-methyltransferase